MVALLEQLKELENAAARSVAVEMESAAQDETTLIDHIGRKRILALCDEIRQQSQRVSSEEKRAQIEKELQDAVMGTSRWLHRNPETPERLTEREGGPCGWSANFCFIKSLEEGFFYQKLSFLKYDFLF